MSEIMTPIGWAIYELERRSDQWTWHKKNEGYRAEDANVLSHPSGFSIILRNVNYPLVFSMHDAMKPKESDLGDYDWRQPWFTYGNKEKRKIMRAIKKHLNSGVCPVCKSKEPQ